MRTNIQKRKTMPLKPIEFDHKGKTIHAEIVYDFSHVSNTVLIIPENNARELNDNILLTRENEHWKTSSIIKKRFPVTFHNIISSVNKELNLEESQELVFFAF